MKKKVKIFDREYELDYKEESDEYAKKVFDYVDSKYKEIGRLSKIKSLPDIALLVSLNLADELMEERQKKEELIRMIERGITNLERIKKGSLSCS